MKTKVMTNQNHMLSYWIKDKGIDTAFNDYYPHLLKQDKEIKDWYAGYKMFKNLLLQKAEEMEGEYNDNDDEDYSST